MAKIEITKPELVWPGKYNEDGTLREVPRVHLPFQVIERVNESRATREAKKGGLQTTLFDAYQGTEGDTFDDGWRNKLIWGDNLLVMGALLEKFAGKVDLIYIDPPFATGTDFSFKTEIGEKGLEVEKEQTAIEEKAYRDTWGGGMGSYLQMISQRLTLMRDLLANDGSIYVHCDWRVDWAIRAAMNEIFGSEYFRNEIIWHYENKLGTGWGAKTFDTRHDVLLKYSKGKVYAHNEITEKVKVQKMQPVTQKIEGERVWLKNEDGSLKYAEGASERPVGDVWTIPIINPVANERLNYPTQKPEALLERVLLSASNKGDLVADFFCGSGTTPFVAETHGRRWIACDLGRWGTHVTRKRLLGVENCRPFEILNLGKYERQYWQGVTLGAGHDQQTLLYEYLAFVLKLYRAQPISGLSHLHGKKGRAMVHIGAIDSPVTIDEVSVAIEECVKVKQPELHVLGWEWEMGLAGPNNDIKKGSPMHEVAKQRGIKLLLLQIPREVMEQQAAAKGDVTFFELAYLNVEIKHPKKLNAAVKLRDFVIPNTELIPEEVRDKVKKWSDYIDYWAVDWDFQNDSFMQGWVTYRIRKDRTLSLESDAHKYEKPGTYRLLVKVVDIFGNDTSQAYTVEVK
jgi:DNA modification methylase